MAALLLLLSACQTTEIVKTTAIHVFDDVSGKNDHTAEGHYKVGDPYRAEGQWYYPKEDPHYQEEGTASWYGKEFDGKPTANGETFDKDKISAAHRTLPLPSMVRVTNLDNGKSLLVRINDRGPYSKERILDISEKGAKELGFYGVGTAQVRVEFDRSATEKMLSLMDPNKYNIKKYRDVGRDSVQTASTDTLETSDTMPLQRGKGGRSRVKGAEKLYVQTGSYTSYKSARSIVDRLMQMRFATTRIQEVAFPERTVYRVRLGPFANVNEADTILNRIGGAGFNNAIIVRD